jgi:hypothetical protein
MLLKIEVSIYFEGGGTLAHMNRLREDNFGHNIPCKFWFKICVISCLLCLRWFWKTFDKVVCPLVVSQFLNQWSKSYWIYSDFHHLKLIKNYKILLFNQSMPLHHIVFSIFPITSPVLTLDVNDIWIHTWPIRGSYSSLLHTWPITFEHFNFQCLFHQIDLSIRLFTSYAEMSNFFLIAHLICPFHILSKQTLEL